MSSDSNLYSLFRDRFAHALDQTFLRREWGQSRFYDDRFYHDAAQIDLEAPDVEAGLSPSRLAYGEADRLSGAIARTLREAGVGPGDRVVVQVPKSIESVCLYLGVLRAGAVYVPLNTAYVVDEVDFFLDDCKPALSVLDGQTLDALIDDANTAEPTESIVRRAPDDLAAIVYTSGTTGRPKGAMLTHRNLASNALALHDIWRFEPGDVLLHILPIFHVHGLFVALHTAILNASEVIFPDRFDVDTVLAHLPESTVMMGVPTHYVRLLADDRLDERSCSGMRLFTSGSAPLSERTHRSFTERTGHEILERYGMSETGMITSNPYDGERVAGSVGCALPGVEVRVEGGVVQVRGPNVFAGYWGLPDRTSDSFTDDGWFTTGDLGELDDDGRLTLQGRADDMIISGGLNIHPKEIEVLIDGIDGVVESAVIGVPHPDLGQAVVAVVVRRPSDEFDADDILGELDGRLAGFKIPRAVEFVAELPRNAMGKVQKKALRDRFADLFI